MRREWPPVGVFRISGTRREESAVLPFGLTGERYCFIVEKPVEKPRKCRGNPVRHPTHCSSPLLTRAHRTLQSLQPFVIHSSLGLQEYPFFLVP
jgi:hypothetical protein